MVGVKEICALLLAGGMGATSVVTVQKAAPQRPKVHSVAQKPRQFPAPKAVKSAPVVAPAGRVITVMDCPSGSAFAAVPVLPTALPTISDAPTQPDAPIYAWVPPGGGVAGPSILPPPGGGGGGGAPIPEPVAWAMMVTGFGLVGAAARRRTAAGETA